MEETASEEGPKGTLRFCLRRCKNRNNGVCALGTDWVSEDPCERQVKDDKWGQVQGEKEISLTGFLSCTTDLMEIGGREWRMGWHGMWDKRWKRKSRQLMRFTYNKQYKSKT